MKSITLKTTEDKFIIESEYLTKDIILNTKNNSLVLTKIDNKYEVSINTLDDLCSKYEKHIEIYYSNKPLDLTNYKISIDESMTISLDNSTYYLYSTKKNILKINVNQAPSPLSNIIDSTISNYSVKDNRLYINLLLSTKILTPESIDFIALNRTSERNYELKDIDIDVLNTSDSITNCSVDFNVELKDLYKTTLITDELELVNDIIDFYFRISFKEQQTNESLVRIAKNNTTNNLINSFKYNEDYNINLEFYSTVSGNFSLRYSFSEISIVDVAANSEKTKILVVDSLNDNLGRGFELFEKIYNYHPELDIYYLTSYKCTNISKNYKNRIVYYRSAKHFEIFNQTFIFLYSDNIVNLLPIFNTEYRRTVNNQQNMKLVYEITNPDERHDKDNSKLNPTLNNQFKIIESYFNFNTSFKVIFNSTYLHRKLSPLINKYKKFRRNITWKNYKYLFSRLPIKEDKIVFESFYGNSLAGNPMEILKYMLEDEAYRKMKFVVVENKNIHPFNNVTYVPKYSAKYLYHVATSKYVISNVRLGKRINFRSDQYYIQTWHGTPIKRLVHDMKSFKIGKGDKERYLRNFDYDVSKWSLLFIPNNYSDNILKSAFHYTGPTILGYPRNYPLTVNYEKEYIDSLKTSLSINLEDKVYLYTPTFREDNTEKTSVYIHSLKLDLERLSKIKGKTFLIRTHYLISNSLDISGYDNIIDVSNHPEINDLFLVSDVLINDYSSTMFDFHYLKRPVILYAYDLEHYMNELRGFYMDYYSLSSNICYTEKELLDVIMSDSEELLNLSDDFTPRIDMNSIIEEILNIDGTYKKSK